MAATKVRSSIWSGQSLAASSADTVSSWINISAGYGANIDIKLTNGATGPTVPAKVQVEYANDYNGGSPNLPIDVGGRLIGLTNNLGVISWPVPVDIGVQSIRLTAGSNTGQAVTIDADISNVTAIS